MHLFRNKYQNVYIISINVYFTKGVAMQCKILQYNILIQNICIENILPSITKSLIIFFNIICTSSFLHMSCFVCIHIHLEDITLQYKTFKLLPLKLYIQFPRDNIDQL